MTYVDLPSYDASDLGLDGFPQRLTLPGSPEVFFPARVERDADGDVAYVLYQSQSGRRTRIYND